MALYFVSSGDSALLVRARNGSYAMDLSGFDNPQCFRVHEIGDEGIIGPDGAVIRDESHHERDDQRETEITTLSDRGVRRFRNLRTGEERTEPRD